MSDASSTGTNYAVGLKLCNVCRGQHHLHTAGTSVIVYEPIRAVRYSHTHLRTHHKCEFKFTGVVPNANDTVLRVCQTADLHYLLA